jgi:hypothetical protein
MSSGRSIDMSSGTKTSRPAEHKVAGRGRKILLGGSDNIQLIMGSSECMVTQWSMVKHSVSTNAQ